MEQIYYTQCPVGYGLGASNGFQIKRASKGYPLSGDFRHLGLRAFPGGARTLAPASLRYRRDGEVAEVARLTPRPNEYETERGYWGRPGGHFAHGLRLSADELRAIADWPAGLFDSPAWKRTDREPTRGRAPDEVGWSGEVLALPPTFDRAAPLADGVDPDRLARLLTALAKVTREGRTLFLVAEPDRLAPLVALLTFAFPASLRGDLTFSTYHDRPEELPGYRISGTIPLARPNKPALTAQGVVADLTLGTFEPSVEPAGWAVTLAGWLTRHDPVDEADWSTTDARAKAARKPNGDESAWSDDWLGPLFRYPEAKRSKAAPVDPAGWSELEGFHAWLGKTGLAEEWVRARDPRWWLDAAGSAKGSPEARSALVALATLRDSWRGEARPSAWGEVASTWFRDVDAPERDEAIGRILNAAPKSARPAFARALLRGLTPSGAGAVLRRLRADPSSDRAMLLPLEMGAAIVSGADPATVRAIVEEALTLPGATSAVLDSVEAGAVDHPEARAGLAQAVAPAFDPEGRAEGREGIAWALRRPDASSWLAPALRPILADPGRPDLRASLLGRVAEDDRPAFARAALAIADDETMPDEAFRWAVEAALLPLAPRPNAPGWAETYLRRTASGLDLLKRLVAPEYRKLGVLGWLEQARGRGELSAEQAGRIDSCLDYARALNSRDPNSLLKVHVPDVAPEERPSMLGQMLAHVGGDSLEGLPFVLDACRQSWPGAFDPGVSGLRSLAHPLAVRLAKLGLQPGPWLARTSTIVERLGLANAKGRGFEPDGLAAEMVAATSKLLGESSSPWPLRQFLLRDGDAWRLLAADARRELAEVDPDAAPEVLARWDRSLVQDRPERFWTMFLNACDGRRLRAVVSARAADLKTLPALPWWGHLKHPKAIDDLRDGYARTVPIAPLGEGLLFQVRGWVEGPSKGTLSPLGLDRWRCLEALTNFQNAGKEPQVRWPIVQVWENVLPLASLAPDDRHRFAAWLIFGLEEAESYQIARLAAWLKKSGMKDPNRLARWADELDGLVEVPGLVKLNRSGLAGELRSELYRQLKDEVDARGSKPPAPRPR